MKREQFRSVWNPFEFRKGKLYQITSIGYLDQWKDMVSFEECKESLILAIERRLVKGVIPFREIPYKIAKICQMEDIRVRMLNGEDANYFETAVLILLESPQTRVWKMNKRSKDFAIQ